VLCGDKDGGAAVGAGLVYLGREKERL